MKDINEAVQSAKTPRPLYCPECDEEMFSSMDKLSIELYGKCSVHHEENSHQENNLLKIIQEVF